MAVSEKINGDSSQGIASYVYDGLGRIQAKTTPGAAIESYYYPDVTNALPAAQAAWFSAAGGADVPHRAVVVDLPNHSRKIRLFDDFGNVVRSIDTEGAVTTGATTSYRYGAFNQLEQVSVDSLSSALTTIVADDLGRVTERTDPARGTELFEYNQFDEQVTHTDASLIETRSSYDLKGRLTAIETGDGDGQETIARWIYGGPASSALGNFGPNALGRLVAAYRQSRPRITTEQGGTTTTRPRSTTGNWTVYQYQGTSRGLLGQVSYVLGAPATDPLSGDPFVVGFTYEPGTVDEGAVPWRLQELNYPSQGGAFAIQYDYDPGSGVMTGVRDKAQPTTSIWKLTKASYGIQPKEEEFGNGVVTKRQYYSVADAATPDCANGATCVPGTLHTIATQAQDPISIAAVQDLSYQYDSMGNVASIVDGVDPTQSRVYQYDGLDRLSKEYAGDRTTLLSQTTHDLAGNIRSRFTAQDGNSTYVYQTAGKPYQLDAVTTQSTNGSWVFGYSTTGNGNIASRLGPNVPGFAQQFEYDALNMPSRVVSGTTQPLGDGARIRRHRRARHQATPLQRRAQRRRPAAYDRRRRALRAGHRL